MHQKSKKNAVGFPPPILGEKPLRLSVLAETNDWLALDKPIGFGTRAHPWDNVPDIDEALNIQLEAGKPELVRRGATLFGSMYYLDPSVSGVAVFAKSRDALANLRNRFGSGESSFRFKFLADSLTLVEILTIESSSLIYEYKRVSLISSGNTDRNKANSRSFNSLLSLIILANFIPLATLKTFPISGISSK